MDMPVTNLAHAKPETGSELLESFPVGVVICDAQGRIAETNSELLRLFGYEQHEVLGQSIDKLLPEKDRAAHGTHLRTYMANPSKRIMGAGRELFGQRKNGSVFLVEIGLNPIDRAEGRGVLATVADITAQRRAEINFRRMVDAAPVGMLIVDATGRIRQSNRQLHTIFGYTEAELRDQPLEMLIPERHRANHPEQRRSFHTQPSARTMGNARDLTGLHKSGIEIPVEVGLNPIETEEGHMVIATVVDITARKKAELKLKQLNAELDEFTYVASHDLRSPLRGISNLAEWISEDLGESVSDDTRNNLERIHQRVARMEKLVDDLLSYARSGRQGSDITSINLRTMIDDVVKFVDPPAAFHVEVTGELGTIRTSLTPLETVLRNLISNAIKHHDREQGTINIRVAHDNAHCIIDVEDDGPGIPANAHERVFRLFQSLSSKDGARSGVGLAVCKRLVEAHGGKIELHSTDGQRGTRFRFWWPRFARRDIND